MDKNIREVVTESPAQTKKLAAALAKTLHNGAVLLLHGDLGGGKTTFTQGLAGGLGIKHRITSPTFTVVRTHEFRSDRPAKLPSGGLGTGSKKVRAKKLYHIDLYRIENENGLMGIGIEEILNDPENIVVIEWAEKLGSLIPDNSIEVWFEYIDNSRRKISIKDPAVGEARQGRQSQVKE